MVYLFRVSVCVCGGIFVFVCVFCSVWFVFVCGFCICVSVFRVCVRVLCVVCVVCA